MDRCIYTGDKPQKEIYEVFAETLEELFKEDPAVVYIDADLMASMKTKGLWDRYPNNVFNTGIQEANMVGVACGMNLYGLKPYIHSFAPFATRRCYDQSYISIGYANKSVRIIGSEPGICAADNGGTHMTFEDMALMRCVPNACVVDVSDGTVLRFALRETKDREGLTYIRTPRRGIPDIYANNTTFELGKGKVLTEGNDIGIIASGIMVATALEAAKDLSKEGIGVTVIDPITIKPIDIDLLLQVARNVKVLITAENHSILGGLAGCVAEVLTEYEPRKVGKIGICDRFGQVGNEDFLRVQYSLTKEDIINKAKKMLRDYNR